MSDIIRLLPDSVANKIAAGEVVQRPVSVVKELLENSIDAGATNIRLILKDAGKTLIQVVDDGKGMSETDARMCFERHATSKISAAEDLFALRTMGFRGEAMAAIASVAQVELRTKQREQELGTKIQIEGSKIIEQSVCQTAVGTSISVKNLFFNIPARRQFLKSDSIELKHIIDEFQQIAISHCHISFSLHHNEEKLFQLPATQLRHRLVGIFGNKINANLIPIEEETDVLKITGYICKPDFAKKTRGEQFFFVNTRFIRSGYLHHAVMTAYEDLLAKKLFPFYAIFLEIDPSKIDVNVHPTKQEIKFDDERLVYNYLRVTVRHGLAQHNITPSLDFEVENGIAQHLDTSSLTPKDDHPISLSSKHLSGANDNNKKENISYKRPERSPLEESNLRNWEKLYEGLGKSDKFPTMTPLGNDEQTTDNDNEQEEQTFSSKMSSSSEENKLIDEQIRDVHPSQKVYQLHLRYILSPIKSGFMLIDQNAAHQRILYERFLGIFRNRQALTQSQLFPTTIQLSASNAQLLRSILNDIQQLGIDIREFGGTSFVIHGMPIELQNKDYQLLIEELLEQYEYHLHLQLDIHDSLARSVAYHSAIPQGRPLAEMEMHQIIDELFACQMPQISPNGRKTFITIELDELKKRFE